MDSQFGIQQFEFPLMDFTDFSPSSIPQHIRLGHQMEFVCKQLLDHSSQYEVIVHNLPIRDKKQTIGEVDFIVQEPATQKIIHVELTYKFYIIDIEISEPIHQLIGPNRRDTFFTKMVKIKNKQFPLLHTKVGSAILAEKGIDISLIRHEACFKAQLFEPYDNHVISMNSLNMECIVGYWLRIIDLQNDSFSSYQFYIPNKSQWVIEPHNEVQWTSHFNLLLEIKLRLIKLSSPMVWMRKSKTEFEKFFVVWW